MHSRKIFAQTLPPSVDTQSPQTSPNAQPEIVMGTGSPITKRPMTGLEAKSYIISNPGPKAVMANIQETLSSIGFDPNKTYSDAEMASIMSKIQANLMSVFGKLYSELGVKV